MDVYISHVNVINICFYTEKKKSFAQQIKKRFSRSKKRSLSADRASSSLREGSNYLKPPDQGFGPQSKGSVNILLMSNTVCDA